MKLAFADRAFWLGDSDFAKVPLGLIDPDYIKKLSAKIDLDKVSAVVAHGVPPRSDSLFFDDRKHTTHLTAADSQGNWVAMTATVNTTWGNKMVVPGTGVVLNNEMDDFSVAPGTANAFGLIGAEANAVAGGKRPLSSMSPTIVLDAEQRPLLTCGAAGGPKIINTALQVILRCIDLGQSIDEAIAASRIHHQWSPDTLAYESSLHKKWFKNSQNEDMPSSPTATWRSLRGSSVGEGNWSRPAIPASIAKQPPLHLNHGGGQITRIGLPKIEKRG